MSSWSRRSDSSVASVAGGRLLRRCERLDVHPQLGDAVEAGRRAADRALLLDGQVEAGDPLQLAVEEVDAADVHLGGRAVGGADHRAGHADQREVVVEFVEDVFDLGGGDRVHREDRGHGVGIGGPGGVGGDRAIGQQAVDGERIAGDVDQVELLAVEQTAWRRRS